MRKKSHISLAKFLMENIEVKDLIEHKKAFYIGSILPDLKPSFLTRRHTIEETFHILIREIKKITVDYDVNKGIGSYYARRLGVITHYLADYCTYPHNSIFSGTITDHVYYEKELKHSLREYVKSETAIPNREESQSLETFEEIIRFIIITHKKYLKAIKEVKEDIRYIVDLCFKVIDAIIQLFRMAFHQVSLTKSSVLI